MSDSRTIAITRTVSFSAAHRYANPALSEEENRRVFGACYREHGHGHNYKLDVTVEGPVDPVTGMVMNLADLDAILKEHVVAQLDHSFLNYDVPHFTQAIPTCENLAVYVFGQLQPLLADVGAGALTVVRVWESDDLFAECRG